MAKPTLLERISAKIEPDPDTGCWIWTAAKNQYGYGVVGIETGKTGLAHRVAYRLMVGDIPEGLDLDHLCRTRACIRPEHLEPVTRRTNLLRGDTATARNAAKTHCPSGHPYSGTNLIVQRSGSRMCRACVNVRKAAAGRRTRAEARSRRLGAA
jgi:hypothetical protein